MLKPLLFATIAAIGNAIFVYGQRGAEQPANPFLYVLGSVTVCTLLFLAASLVYRTGNDLSYLSTNYRQVLIGGLGFFITFVGFFLLYSQFGASYYVLYAILSIITTTIGVGVLIYREPFNIYQWLALGLAVGAIILFSYGKIKGSG